METSDLFVSKSAELIFTLTRMDGGYRCDALGITEAMYDNKPMAKKWFNDLYSVLQKSTHPKKEEAMTELKEMYSVMVDSDSW